MATIYTACVWTVFLLIVFDRYSVVNSNVPGSFRLVGGTNGHSGRVEVYLRGEWGTVCDDGFGTKEARVLCKTLGFPSRAAMAVSWEMYGKGSGKIWLDDIVCPGAEMLSIQLCNSSPVGSHNCDHDEDVGIVCTDAPHRYRLVNGRSSRDGHVQIYTGSKWTSVSSENFDPAAGTVLCKSLNLPYHAVNIQHYNCDGAVWLENMECSGTEPSLYTCREKTGENHHWNKCAAVVCIGGCNVPTNPNHGAVRYTGTNTGDHTTYTCNTGYILQGSSTTSCSSTGYWSPGAPACKIKDCGSLTPPRHGSVNCKATVYQSIATYTCNTGFVLQGSNTTTCISSGRWDTVPPTCEPIDCGIPTKLKYGFCQFNKTVFGSIGVFDCLKGYVLSGINSTACLYNGSWSGDPPVCNPIDCGNLTSPGHGEIDLNTTTFQSFATYTCDIGFVLQGSNITNCLSSGNWSTDRPACDARDCGIPHILVNGYFQVNDTVFGSVGVFGCLEGYILSGINSTECLYNGSWSGDPPVCNPIDCGNPDEPSNGFAVVISTVYKAVAIYYCYDGYVLQGSKSSHCLAIGNWKERPPSCKRIADVKRGFCKKDIDKRGMQWDATAGETIVTIPCSTGDLDLVGDISRYCNGAGSWLYPVYNCVRAEFRRIEESIDRIRTNVSALAIVEALHSLSLVTHVADPHVGVYAGEIRKTVDMLDTIANISSDIAITEVQSQSFVETVGNLLDTKNHEAWQAISQSSNRSLQTTKTEKTSTKVLQAVGQYAGAISKTLDETNQTEMAVPNRNLILLVAKIDQLKSLQFPSQSLTRMGNLTQSTSFRLDKKSVKGATGYSGVIYKNLTGILPSTIVPSINATNKIMQTINSEVLDVQLHSNLSDKLPSPIVLHFSPLQTGYTDANCMFWNEQRNGWDTSGCRKISSNLTSTVCECDHLTNFAILMSPWKQKSVATKAIDALTYAGCSVSMVFLVVTVVCHLLHWRSMKPHFRTVVLMHLCVALVFSYLLFLFGADKTANKNVCTVMASLLHYIYLVVFFIMLAECIDVAWIVHLPLKQSSKPKWTLTAAWALPAVIVGISLGVTRLHGYGTESYCWLSKENGLIWAFVAPALLVILCNLGVLVSVLKTLCETRAMKDKTVPERVRSSVWCLLVLLPVTGFAWILGIFHVNEDSAWLQYLFVICNTLQGFVIFLFYCVLNKQLVQAVKQRRKKRHSSHLHTSTATKHFHFHVPFKFSAGSTGYDLSETSSTKL